MKSSSVNSKLKICIVCSEFPPKSGGISYHVYNIARLLSQRGHDVTVITRGNWYKNTSTKTEDGINLYRVKFIPLYPFHVKIHGIFIQNMLKELDLNFDVIHLHTPLVPFIRKLTPYIATQHSVIIRAIKARRGLDLYSLGYKILRKPIEKIDYRIAGSASINIAVSKQKSEELQLFYKIPSERIIIIPNGVNSNFFMPADKQNRQNLNVLYCGRIDALKGIDDFVTATHYIHKERGDVQFVVAGKGIGTLEHSVKNRVESYNMTDNFHFLGSINQLELRQYYQQASIYVHPSLYEGIPLSLLEAMSCALPCIATNIPGNADVIDNGINGILVEPGNPEMLAEKTLMLLNDTQKCMELGENARKKIVKNYDWNRIVDMLEDVYQSNWRR